jgi:S-(hydroxymethyl)glutathione dehydrogenase / alcohol dehydrogenase
MGTAPRQAGREDDMQITAAVMTAPGHPLRVRSLDLDPPGPGEVLIELAASGVCHSDLSVFSAALPSRVPVVLGHEGAGVVRAVGDGVRSPQPGDHVVLSWLAQCGECRFCQRGQPALCAAAGFSFATNTLPDGSTRLSTQDGPVYQMAGLGTLASHCVVPSRSAVVIPADLPLDSAALLGCAVLTGFGAAANTASIQAGDSVAVLGCGGVGLNAVQGARASGAGVIIGIDPVPGRRALARRVGATHVLGPAGDLLPAVRALTGGRGADVAIEAAGREETISQALRLTRRGGQVVLVGAGGNEVRLSVPAFTGIVMTGKSILGSLYGSCDVQRDIPRLVSRYRAGDLLLDELVTGRFGLAEVNQALEYCAASRGARAVVTYSSGHRLA